MLTAGVKTKLPVWLSRVIASWQRRVGYPKKSEWTKWKKLRRGSKIGKPCHNLIKFEYKRVPSDYSNPARGRRMVQLCSWNFCFQRSRLSGNPPSVNRTLSANHNRRWIRADQSDADLQKKKKKPMLRWLKKKKVALKVPTVLEAFSATCISERGVK